MPHFREAHQARAEAAAAILTLVTATCILCGRGHPLAGLVVATKAWPPIYGGAHLARAAYGCNCGLARNVRKTSEKQALTWVEGAHLSIEKASSEQLKHQQVLLTFVLPDMRGGRVKRLLV